MNKLIELQNINKHYAMGSITVNALSDIHLCINEGEYVAILGPSGSGKSTLMNVLGCLDQPSSGRYILSGQDVSLLKRNQLAKVRSKKIGFIFQSFNLLDYATALDNVCLPLIYQGIKKSERLDKARHILEKVGLSERMQHHPNELSGGQRQRVAIARALVTDPQVILADEPTGNLDTESGNEITQLFKTLSEQGKTIITVTHDNALAKKMQRVLTIEDGRIVADTQQ